MASSTFMERFRESRAWRRVRAYQQGRITFKQASQAYKYLVSRGYRLHEIGAKPLAQPQGEGQEDERG